MAGQAFKFKPTFKGEFVDGSAKDALIAANEPFEIVGIRFSPKGQYGPQFYLKCNFIEGSVTGLAEGTMTWTADGTVFTRDDLLEQAAEYLKANKGETLIARLSQEGQTKLVNIEED